MLFDRHTPGFLSDDETDHYDEAGFDYVAELEEGEDASCDVCEEPVAASHRLTLSWGLHVYVCPCCHTLALMDAADSIDGELTSLLEGPAGCESVPAIWTTDGQRICTTVVKAEDEVASVAQEDGGITGTLAKRTRRRPEPGVVAVSNERACLKKPCRGCPFARKTTTAYLNRRGENVRRFIGQSVGPFLLPCHQHADREDWPLDVARPQCVGAAMHRDLLGVGEKMPAELTRANGNPELVFSTSAEYLAHHDGCTLAEAEQKLRDYPVERHFHDEWVRAKIANRKVKAPQALAEVVS